MLYVTDSQGWVAFDEPGLLGENVFFHVESHGYDYPQDFLGQRGRAFETKPGGRAQIELQRVNLAERLYRITGQGIYADSLRLGESVPLQRPVLSGLVTGQDSVQTALVDETLYWFWGDTNRPSYPLGHFGTSVAKSVPPQAGGLAADQGVDLQYFVDAQGFSEPAFDARGGLMTWLDGVMVVPSTQGPAKIVGHYSVMKSLGERLEHGLAVFDSEMGKFEKIMQWPVDAVLEPGGQVLLVSEPEGPYFYFCTPFPAVRVRATWETIDDPSVYQALTPLRNGTRFRGAATQLATDQEGRLDYDWKTATPPLRPSEEAQLVKLGRLSAAQAHWQTVDADSDHPVTLHSGNVSWNQYRQRYVMVAVQSAGKHSFLGDVWYAESRSLAGPWRRAVRIVSHRNYSFYNPRQHPYLSEPRDRFIYFEGTYTSAFSRAKSKTPRYDYNQIMYRLDLDDSRLSPAQEQP